MLYLVSLEVKEKYDKKNEFHKKLYDTYSYYSKNYEGDENIKDITAARVNAINRNIDFCSA